MQTPKMNWAAYLWPGFSRLWVRGSWAGLAVAVGFTALANVLLVSSLVYSDWIATDVRLGGGAVLVLLWCLAWLERRADRQGAAQAGLGEEAAGSLPPAQEDEERDDEFREIQRSYLRGDWVATEQRLLALLRRDARDVEGRLMLATLWRHQERFEEASRQLNRLSRLEAADKWQAEIAAERAAIEEKRGGSTEAPFEQQDKTENPTEDTDRRMAA